MTIRADAHRVNLTRRIARTTAFRQIDRPLVPA
jgi:hypothetical protein